MFVVDSCLLCPFLFVLKFIRRHVYCLDESAISQSLVAVPIKQAEDPRKH